MYFNKLHLGILLYIVMNLFQGAPDYLGRAMTTPQVNLDPADSALAILQWSSIKKGPTDGGEILFAAELFLVSTIVRLIIIGSRATSFKRPLVD